MVKMVKIVKMDKIVKTINNKLSMVINLLPYWEGRGWQSTNYFAAQPVLVILSVTIHYHDDSTLFGEFCLKEDVNMHWVLILILLLAMMVMVTVMMMVMMVMMMKKSTKILFMEENQGWLFNDSQLPSDKLTSRCYQRCCYPPGGDLWQHSDEDKIPTIIYLFAQIKQWWYKKLSIHYNLEGGILREGDGDPPEDDSIPLHPRKWGRTSIWGIFRQPPDWSELFYEWL